MKNLLLFLLITAPGLLVAQKNVDESFALNGADAVEMQFEWPKVISVEYHDKQEVVVKGTSSINYGQYDDAFTLSSRMSGGTLYITSEIENLSEIPKMRIEKNDNGSRNIVRNEKNGTVNIISDGDDKAYTGVSIEIFLTVYLPKGISAEIDSKFGLVEVKEVEGPLLVNSKFGGVDVFINENQQLDIKAATAFGDIFTDLTSPFEGNGKVDSPGDWQRVDTKIAGGGMNLDVESKFGNVYLRKTN